MPTLSLDPKALEDYLPHRGVNLMVDEITILDGGQASQSVTVVPPGDPRGREFLARRNGAGERLWYEPFAGELLALTGVTLLHEHLAPRGLVGVFSAISRASFPRAMRQDRPLVAQAEIRRSRGEFWQFAARFLQDDELCFSGEIMAGAAPLAEISSAPVRSAPSPGGEAPIADFSWKDPALRFLDEVVSCGDGSLRGWYRYPEDHPFVPTHFPGGALMMGVTQWATIADAAWEAAVRLGLGSRISASGRITRPDGDEVVEIRDLELDGSDGIPAITATKRVAFREPVRPGDALFIDVEVAAC